MSYMRSEQRTRQILGCAKRVFAERGFHAANISHICAAAGIGRGTLYQYFANKRAVLEAILRETLDRVRALMERQEAALVPVVPPEKVTRSAVIELSARQLRELLEVVFEDDHTLRILLREAVSLVASQRAGFVRELDARAVATMVVGGVEKLALAALRRAGPVDLDLLAREATRLHAIGTLSDRLRPEPHEADEPRDAPAAHDASGAPGAREAPQPPAREE